MRIGTGDEFLRTTGGALTGPLTISANASPLLVLNRPDSALHRAIAFQRGGGNIFSLYNKAAEPFLEWDNAADAAILTQRTDTGLIGTALIPLSLLKVANISAQQGIAVTVLAADTVLATLAELTVAVGDQIIVTRSCLLTKGATAGDTKLAVRKSAGTATIVVDGTSLSAAENESVLAAGTWTPHGSVVFRVTGAGTLTLDLAASSAGSNSTAAAGAGRIEALQLRG